MSTIEYDGHTLHVPTTWDDIKVGHYETFWQERPNTARERVALIATICKVDAALLLAWPADVFNVLVEKTAFLFQDAPAEPNPGIAIDGNIYVVAVEDKLSLGEYLDAGYVQKNEPAMYSNLLAVLCRPVGEEYNPNNNEARTAMFAALPVSKVQGVLAFFLHCKQVLELRTTAYTNLIRTVSLLPHNISDLRKHGVTIKLSRILQGTTYFVLIWYLNYRLRRLLRFSSTAGIKTMRTKRKGNLTVN